MTVLPAATRQEGTQTSVPLTGAGQLIDRSEIDLYRARCKREGEQLIGWYKRLTVERTFEEQVTAVRRATKSQPMLQPMIRRLIAAVDGELSGLRSVTTETQRLVRYRRALDSLSLILRQQLTG